MLRTQLKETAARSLKALEEIMARLLMGLWTMAVRNKRTTAGGLVAGFSFLAAKRGFNLTPEQQANLGFWLMVLIGLVAGDGYLRRRGR